MLYCTASHQPQAIHIDGVYTQMASVSSPLNVRCITVCLFLCVAFNDSWLISKLPGPNYQGLKNADHEFFLILYILQAHFAYKVVYCYGPQCLSRVPLLSKMTEESNSTPAIAMMTSRRHHSCP